MSVFDNTTKVDRKVKDPGTDKKLSGGGSLTYGSITTPAGLAGCVGIDAKLVHGDRWQQIDQTQTTMITGSELMNITQNQTVMVIANRSLTVVGNVMEVIVGAHNLLQVGAQTDLHIAPHNRVNCSPESQQEPTNKFRLFGVEFEVKSSESTIVGSQMEIIGMGTEVAGLKNEMCGVSIENKIVDMCNVLGISIEPKVSEVHLDPLHVFLEGAHAKLAAGTAAVSPSVNAVPHAPTMGGH